MNQNQPQSFKTIDDAQFSLPKSQTMVGKSYINLNGMVFAFCISALAAIVSVMLTGFKFGGSNNVYHIPYEREVWSYPTLLRSTVEFCQNSNMC
jgi:hypothetical protein